jgi:hypothetical protein
MPRRFSPGGGAFPFAGPREKHLTSQQRLPQRYGSIRTDEITFIAMPEHGFPEEAGPHPDFGGETSCKNRLCARRNGSTGPGRAAIEWTISNCSPMAS